MATLAEYQKTQMGIWTTAIPILNGIDCNGCGEQLYDTQPGVIVKLGPPETPVHCDTCGYKGYRIDLT